MNARAMLAAIVAIFGLSLAAVARADCQYSCLEKFERCVSACPAMDSGHSCADGGLTREPRNTTPAVNRDTQPESVSEADKGGSRFNMSTGHMLGVLLGYGLILFGWIYCLVLAYRDNLGWLLLVFFFPPLGMLIFVAMDWRNRRTPVFTAVFGTAVASSVAGVHRATWLWYSGDRQIDRSLLDVDLLHRTEWLTSPTPNPMSPGPHRVELYVDGKLVDSQPFDVR